MFDANQREDLKTALVPFSFDRPWDATAPMPLCMQLYLEFYGFFETIKAMDVEYFWGVRQVDVAGESFGSASPVGVATHFWQRPNSKGCVFLVHGLFDHVGLFQKLIRYILLQGYSVVAIDLPGHGLSDGCSTQVGRFEDYAEVVTQTLRYFQPRVGDDPCFGIGQSTGAAVLMAAAFKAKALNNVDMFERLIFLGPLVRPKGYRLSRVAHWLLGRFIPHIKRGFSYPNSNDSEFHHFLQYSDPLQAKALSIEWIGAMFHWVDRFAGQPQIETPLLILQGTEDRVVDWEFNVGAIQEHFTRSQVNYIKGAMHHLANEADPWQKVVYSSIRQFLSRPQIRR